MAGRGERRAGRSEALPHEGRAADHQQPGVVQRRARAALGAAAKTRAADLFSADRIVGRYVDYYRQRIGSQA